MLKNKKHYQTVSKIIKELYANWYEIMSKWKPPEKTFDFSRLRRWEESAFCHNKYRYKHIYIQYLPRKLKIDVLRYFNIHTDMRWVCSCNTRLRRTESYKLFVLRYEKSVFANLFWGKSTAREKNLLLTLLFSSVYCRAYWHTSSVVHFLCFLFVSFAHYFDLSSRLLRNSFFHVFFFFVSFIFQAD